MYPHLNNGVAPTKKSNSAVVARFCFFDNIVRSPPFVDEGAFLFRDLIVQGRTTIVSELFEKTSARLRCEGISAGLLG